MSDHTTPADVQAKLRHLTQELEKARGELATARNDEVEKKQAWEKARRAALLNPDRPRVERGGFTVAERDAWVDDQVATEEQEYRIAEVRRKAAGDHLRTLQSQSMNVMAIGKSVQTEYNAGGRM